MNATHPRMVDTDQINGVMLSFGLRGTVGGNLNSFLRRYRWYPINPTDSRLGQIEPAELSRELAAVFGPGVTWQPTRNCITIIVTEAKTPALEAG